MKAIVITLLSLFTLVGYGQGVTTSYQKQTNITEMSAVRYAQISDFKIKGDMVTYIDSIQFDEYGEPKYMWAGVNKYIVLPYPKEGSGIEEGITFEHSDSNQNIEIIVDTIDTIWKSYDGRSIKIQDLIDYQEYCLSDSVCVGTKYIYYYDHGLPENDTVFIPYYKYRDVAPMFNPYNAPKEIKKLKDVYKYKHKITFNGFIEWMKNVKNY